MPRRSTLTIAAAIILALTAGTLTRTDSGLGSRDTITHLNQLSARPG